ncbi:aquaporin Z [Leucobacter sp. GX24907]
MSSTTLAPPSTGSRLAAEAIGTFVLVFGGVGTALFAAGFAGDPGAPVNVGFLGVALAFGLTVLVSAYAFGPVSGGHFNPAVTLGLAASGRFAWKDVAGYIIAQLVGGVLASTALFGILDGRDAGSFASNGYGEEGSPGGYSLLSVALIEVILTAVFVLVILGVTSESGAPGFAPLAIGLSLTLIHLISIPISNTSVNPARSIAAAIYGGTLPLSQLWAFIVFPIVGGVLAGLIFHPLLGRVARVTRLAGE